jgi:hypothetical protein
MVKEPVLRAPVENVTVPKFPVVFGLPLSRIAINVDPDRFKPLLDPVSVPPLLLKSTLLSPNEAAGIMRQASATNPRVRDLTETIESLLAEGWLVRRHTTFKAALA